MRNWNQVAETAKQALQSVCSQPMRNWNKKDELPTAYVTEVCSQPMRNWNRQKRCMTRSRAFWFVANLWGIETSRQAFVIFYYTCKFVANLWGIETPDGRIEAQSATGFVANLWGIETISFWYIYIVLIYVCSQPMRNWNVKVLCTRLKILMSL